MRALTRLLISGMVLLASALNAQAPLEPGDGEGVLPLENYQTLARAIALAEFGETLEGSGPFTVFAPSDEAFRKLKGSGVSALLDPENRKELRALVGYHIVAGELTASRILRAMSRGEGAALFTTVQGEPLIATLEGTDIVLMDCSGNQARIVRADESRKRLVFHGIDAVVFPSDR